MKVVITMAGLGTRFKNAGYKDEKYKIMFHDLSLFEWAIKSLINFKNYEFIFVTRNYPKIRSFILEKTQNMGLFNVKIEVIYRETKGQAETVLFAKNHFKEDDSLLIHNIDTHIKPNELKPEMIRGNGWIPVFSALGDHWSFIESLDDGTVIRTTEKKRISNYCSVGMYYFDSFRKFEKLTNTIANNSELNEWFIAPLYNEYIRIGNKVYMHKISDDSVMVLGTPEELKNAERSINGYFCRDR